MAVSAGARGRRVAALLWLGAFAGAAAAADRADPTKLDAGAALARSDAAIGRAVGDFTLLDRRGRPVRLAEFRGKPLLVSFVYTGCFAACPTATRNLHRAVEKAADVLGAGRFNVVSIGFNQPFDSPEAMAAFARKHGIALANWEFLSPSAGSVEALTRNFGFSYVATPAGFDHVTQVALVDASGIIRRQIYGEKPDPDELVEPLKLMVVGAALPARGGGLRELLDRVRILCSVYDAASGEYRVSYAFVIEIVGFGVFFLATLAFLWREFRRQRPLGRP